MPVSSVVCSAFGAGTASTSLMVGCSISLEPILVSRFMIDHWLFGPVEGSNLEDE